MTCAVQILAILSGIGWPTDIPEFDPACECELSCQLISETIDGFPAIEELIHYDAGPDPPTSHEIHPPHCEDNCDPLQWED